MKSIKSYFNNIYLFALVNPIEFFLFILLIWSFLNAFIKSPTFWAPATFIDEDEISSDISLCSAGSRSLYRDNIVKCPRVLADKGRSDHINQIVVDDSIFRSQCDTRS